MRKRMYLFICFTALLFTVLACVQERSFPLASDVKKQMALLPQDAAVYGYVNFKRLHSADFSHIFVDSVKNHMYKDKDLSEFMKVTGLDPNKDIHEIYFAANPTPDKKKSSFLAVASGQFDIDKIVKFIEEEDKKHKIQQSDYEGFTLFVTDEKPIAFCFKDENTLVGGSKLNVQKWLDLQGQTGQKEMNSTVLKQIEKLKYKKGMWLNVDALVLKENIDDEHFGHINGLKSVETLGFSLDFTDKMMLNARGIFGDAEKSKLFEEAIKGFIATGKLSVSDDRDVIDILNSIDVKAEDKTVKVDFKLTEEEAKKILEKKKTFTKKFQKAV